MGGNAPALKAYPAARCRCALPGFAGKAPAFETKPIVDFTGNAPCIEPKPRPDCTGTPQEKHSAAVLTQAGYHMQKKDNSGLTGTACGHDSAARILSPPLCLSLIHILDENGQKVEYETSRPVYALISAEDYLSSTPNYQEFKDLPVPA